MKNEMHLDFQPERICPMQRKDKMTARWCDQAQSEDLCGSFRCVFYTGIVFSKYSQNGQGKEGRNEF